MQITMNGQLSAYSHKDIGGRDEQQDRVAHLLSADGKRALLIVADGMGGHSGGQLASTCVLTGGKIEWEASKEATSISPDVVLQNIFKFSYQCMKNKEKKHDSSPRSTCIALLIKDDIAYYAHVGDSRLYHFRKGVLLKKTKDHSVVQMLADMKKIDENDMATHEDQGKLLKWIGGKKEPEPTFSQTNIRAGDQFLLCSDGLWEHINVVQMERILNKTKDLKKAVTLLVKIAKTSGRDKGDNISIALLHVNSNKQNTSYFLLIYAVLLLIIAFLSGYIIFAPEKNIASFEKPQQKIVTDNVPSKNMHEETIKESKH